MADRILGRLEAIDQRLELLLPLGDVLGPGLERRGHLRDHLDVFSDHLLLLLDFVEARPGCSRPGGRVAPPRTPFFRVQVPLDRLLDLVQRLGHPQAGRMQRSALIVVEDPAHRRAVVEHHGAGGIDHGRRRVRRGRGRRDGGFGIVRRAVVLGLGLLPLEHGLFDRPQAADLLPHLDLGMAVGLQDGLGQVAEEVVVAVAVRHVGELRRDPRHERVLLVRHPERHRLAQGFGPLLGLGDQASDLVRGGGEQRLGEPDPLPGQLPDDVEGLVPLLGLEAVDREDDLADRLVVPAQGLGVLLPRGEHDLVASDVLRRWQSSESLMA